MVMTAALHAAAADPAAASGGAGWCGEEISTPPRPAPPPSPLSGCLQGLFGDAVRRDPLHHPFGPGWSPGRARSLSAPCEGVGSAVLLCGALKLIRISAKLAGSGPAARPATAHSDAEASTVLLEACLQQNQPRQQKRICHFSG